MNRIKDLNVPVAFVIFNRPETTQLVFDEIAKAKPGKLLVVADGPRTDKHGEDARCEQTRAIVDAVDWDCEVLKNYSDINLGCKKRVSTGLDWVFQETEEAIVLEDDCLPHPDFFSFCDEMLDKYRDDTRISQVGGSSFIFDRFQAGDSYYFSKFQFVWGWASWRRAWQSYDVNMKEWPSYRDSGMLEKFFGNRKMASFYKRLFNKTYKGKIDTWDFQWFFTNIINNRFSVIPKANLISNIGFGVDSTNTGFFHPLAGLETAPIKLPLSYPVKVNPDNSIDQHVFENYLKISKIKRIFLKLKSLV